MVNGFDAEDQTGLEALLRIVAEGTDWPETVRSFSTFSSFAGHTWVDVWVLSCTARAVGAVGRELELRRSVVCRQKALTPLNNCFALI